MCTVRQQRGFSGDTRNCIATRRHGTVLPPWCLVRRKCGCYTDVEFIDVTKKFRSLKTSLFEVWLAVPWVDTWLWRVTSWRLPQHLRPTVAVMYSNESRTWLVDITFHSMCSSNKSACRTRNSLLCTVPFCRQLVAASAALYGDPCLRVLYSDFGVSFGFGGR